MCPKGYQTACASQRGLMLVVTIYSHTAAGYRLVSNQQSIKYLWSTTGCRPLDALFSTKMVLWTSIRQVAKDYKRMNFTVLHKLEPTWISSRLHTPGSILPCTVCYRIDSTTETCYTTSIWCPITENVLRNSIIKCCKNDVIKLQVRSLGTATKPMTFRKFKFVQIYSN